MQSILERFEQAKRKGNETLGKTAGVQDEQSDKEEVPGAAASLATAAGVDTAGVGSAHSMDGERCDMELAPSTPQGVEMFTTPMQQLPVDDAHLPVSRPGRRTRIGSKTLASC